MRLEIPWIPQFADEFTKSMNKKSHVISSGCTFDLFLIVFWPQKEITKRTDMTQ